MFFFSVFHYVHVKLKARVSFLCDNALVNKRIFSDVISYILPHKHIYDLAHRKHHAIYKLNLED